MENQEEIEESTKLVKNHWRIPVSDPFKREPRKRVEQYTVQMIGPNTGSEGFDDHWPF